jgi:predicted transposase YbfD/YdcC
MKIIENSLGDLLKHIQTISEPRENHKIEYPLDEILFLAISAVISGCTEWQEIADFGEDKLGWLRKYRPFLNGIPSHDTLNRTISLVNQDVFEEMFTNWVRQSLKLPKGSLISLDGKKVRSSATKHEQQTPKSKGGKCAINLVEAWCSELSLCLSIRCVEEKSNEITAFPVLLDNLNIEGCVISIDAMGCQKEITKSICGKKADYVLGLKLNHPTLFDGVFEAFENAKKDEDLTDKMYYSFESTVDHGRIEERICRVLSADKLPFFVEKEEWTSLNSIIQIQSQRIVIATGMVSNDTRYYITSLKMPANKIAEYVRNHWGIENKLHWSLDVYFQEDYSRKRRGNAAANFGTILRMAHNFLKSEPEKISIKRKLKKCARSDEYREKTMQL